jgi:hypothetical protein
MIVRDGAESCGEQRQKTLVALEPSPYMWL